MSTLPVPERLITAQLGYERDYVAIRGDAKRTIAMMRLEFQERGYLEPLRPRRRHGWCEKLAFENWKEMHGGIVRADEDAGNGLMVEQRSRDEIINALEQLQASRRDDEWIADGMREDPGSAAEDESTAEQNFAALDDEAKCDMAPKLENLEINLDESSDDPGPAQTWSDYLQTPLKFFMPAEAEIATPPAPAEEAIVDEQPETQGQRTGEDEKKEEEEDQGEGEASDAVQSPQRDAAEERLEAVENTLQELLGFLKHQALSARVEKQQKEARKRRRAAKRCEREAERKEERESKRPEERDWQARQQQALRKFQSGDAPTVHQGGQGLGGDPDDGDGGDSSGDDGSSGGGSSDHGRGGTEPPAAREPKKEEEEEATGAYHGYSTLDIQTWTTVTKMFTRTFNGDAKRAPAWIADAKTFKRDNGVPDRFMFARLVNLITGTATTPLRTRRKLDDQEYAVDNCRNLFRWIGETFKTRRAINEYAKDFADWKWDRKEETLMEAMARFKMLVAIYDTELREQIELGVIRETIDHQPLSEEAKYKVLWRGLPEYMKNKVWQKNGVEPKTLDDLWRRLEYYAPTDRTRPRKEAPSEDVHRLQRQRDGGVGGDPRRGPSGGRGGGSNGGGGNAPRQRDDQRRGGRRRRRFARGQCWKCLKQGHFARDCRGERVCYKCKKPGHMSKDCKAKQSAYHGNAEDGKAPPAVPATPKEDAKPEEKPGERREVGHFVFHRCGEDGETREAVRMLRVREADEKQEEPETRLPESWAGNVRFVHCYAGAKSKADTVEPSDGPEPDDEDELQSLRDELGEELSALKDAMRSGTDEVPTWQRLGAAMAEAPAWQREWQRVRRLQWLAKFGRVKLHAPASRGRKRRRAEQRADRASKRARGYWRQQWKRKAKKFWKALRRVLPRRDAEDGVERPQDAPALTRADIDERQQVYVVADDAEAVNDYCTQAKDGLYVHGMAVVDNIGHDVSMLLDTGASCNILSAKMCKKLGAKAYRLRKPVRCDALSDEVQLDKAAMVYTRVGAKQYAKLMFYVVDDMSEPMLIGRDGLARLGIWDKMSNHLKVQVPSIRHEAWRPDYEIKQHGEDKFFDRLLLAREMDQQLRRFEERSKRKPHAEKQTHAGLAPLDELEEPEDERPEQLKNLFARGVNIWSDLSAAEQREFGALLEEYLDVFAMHDFDLGRLDDEYAFRIDLIDGFRGALAMRPKRQTAENKAEIAKMMKKWRRARLVRGSRSEWAAPVVIVSKADGKPRVCVSYVALNRVTCSEHFPMPTFSQLLTFLRGAKYITSFDLCWAYQHVPIHEPHIPRTAFVTEDEHLECLRLVFGFKNGPPAFQRIVTEIFSDYVGKWLFVYLDDILIKAATKREMIERVRLVLERLRRVNFKMRLLKCQFFRREVKYIGRMVSGNGIGPDVEYIDTVRAIKKPTNVSELKTFLGAASWLRRFVPNMADVLAAFSDLKHAKGPDAPEYKWQKWHDIAFERVRELLLEARERVLMLPDSSKPYLLQCDASGVAYGGALLQRTDEGVIKPVAFMSRQFTQAQKRWHISVKELYAIVASLIHWEDLLRGAQDLVVQTDHRNLKFLINTGIHASQLEKWRGELHGKQLTKGGHREMLRASDPVKSHI